MVDTRLPEMHEQTRERERSPESGPDDEPVKYHVPNSSHDGKRNKESSESSDGDMWDNADDLEVKSSCI